MVGRGGSDTVYLSAFNTPELLNGGDARQHRKEEARNRHLGWVLLDGRPHSGSILCEDLGTHPTLETLDLRSRGFICTPEL